MKTQKGNRCLSWRIWRIWRSTRKTSKRSKLVRRDRKLWWEKNEVSNEPQLFLLEYIIITIIILVMILHLSSLTSMVQTKQRWMWNDGVKSNVSSLQPCVLWWGRLQRGNTVFPVERACGTVSGVWREVFRTSEGSEHAAKCRSSWWTWQRTTWNHWAAKLQRAESYSRLPLLELRKRPEDYSTYMKSAWDKTLLWDICVQ